uniref:Probasin n=1 Tax=Rattus norvegicus TaxID=10116 RepID=A0A8L2URJ6_RAT
CTNGTKLSHTFTCLVSIAAFFFQIEGNWRTVYLAASSVEKINEGSPLRTYFRRIECGKRCNRINLYFYIKKGAKCQQFKIVGRRSQDVYYAKYEGSTAFMLKTVNEKILLFDYFNRNRRNDVTRVAGVLAKGRQLTKDEMTEYMNFVEEMGIEDENVQRVMDTGIVATCVCNFLFCIFIINVNF